MTRLDEKHAAAVKANGEMATQETPTMQPIARPVDGALDIGNALGHWGQVVMELSAALVFAKQENQRISAAYTAATAENAKLQAELNALKEGSLPMS